MTTPADEDRFNCAHRSESGQAWRQHDHCHRRGRRRVAMKRTAQIVSTPPTGSRQPLTDVGEAPRPEPQNLRAARPPAKPLTGFISAAHIDLTDRGQHARRPALFRHQHPTHAAPFCSPATGLPSDDIKSHTHARVPAVRPRAPSPFRRSSDPSRNPGPASLLPDQRVQPLSSRLCGRRAADEST